MKKFYTLVLLLLTQNAFAHYLPSPQPSLDLHLLNKVEINLENISRTRIQEYKQRNRGFSDDTIYLLNKSEKLSRDATSILDDAAKFKYAYDQIHDFNQQKWQKYLDKPFKIRVKEDMIIALFEEGEILVIDRFAAWNQLLTKKELSEAIQNYFRFEDVSIFNSAYDFLYKVIRAKLEPVFINKNNGVESLDSDSPIVKKMLEEVSKNKQNLLLN